MSRAADNAFADPRTGLVLALGVAAIVVYYIAKSALSGAASVVSSAANAVGSTVDSATTSIADAYTGLTSQGAVNPTGNIVFPDGSVASVSAVSASNGGLSGPLFTWNGQQYTLTSQFDSNGNRIAQAGPDNSSNSIPTNFGLTSNSWGP